MMASGLNLSGLHHPLAPGVTATPVIIKSTSRISTRNSSARNRGTRIDDNEMRAELLIYSRSVRHFTFQIQSHLSSGLSTIFVVLRRIASLLVRVPSPSANYFAVAESCLTVVINVVVGRV